MSIVIYMLYADETALRIPNAEVKSIFADTVLEWFRDHMKEIIKLYNEAVENGLYP